MRRTIVFILVASFIVSGCETAETSALDLRPLSKYAIQQDKKIPLSTTLKQRLLRYCEQTPTSLLPSRRAEVATIIFRHPFYDELGSKTIKYWQSGEERYVSCLNSDEQNERVFLVEKLDAFEAASDVTPIEVKVEDAISFTPEPDVEGVKRTFSINEAHETIVEGSVFRYQTPDRGALYITYQVFQHGEAKGQMIDPRLLIFESGKNEGVTFLTQLADDRVMLQMGTTEELARAVLPSPFSGEYVVVDSRETVFHAGEGERQLLKRIVLADQPIQDFVELESDELSARYDGTVIEVWGAVKNPGVDELTIASERTETTRLVMYETESKTVHLDGPSTRQLFDLLAHVKRKNGAPTGEYQGMLTLYEQLTEQRFEVWSTRTHRQLQLHDVETRRVYLIDKFELEALLELYI